MWARLDAATRDRYRALRLQLTASREEGPLQQDWYRVAAKVVEHETRGDPVLRFAEPVDDLNAVRVRAGLNPLQSAALVGELRAELRKPDCLCRGTPWSAATSLPSPTNLGLLHGRAAFGALQEAAGPPPHSTRERVSAPGPAP